MLVVWEIDTMTKMLLFKDICSIGIGNCCFSSNGSLVAGVGLDENHTLVIYDVNKAKEARSNPKSVDKGLVAQGNTTKDQVLHMKFDPSDQMLVLGCL